jgi:nitroimidazol reductase NimA-like FMN-containing flavoprotein (pyridoxamine 5'-phosphate oxidase superfamily)
VSRRDQIRMSASEVEAYLEAERTVICATNGRDGFPHLMPLWYVVRDGTVWAWTYAKSQKARNLERDPRATLQVETGERYEELRGLMVRCEAVLHRDAETIGAFLAELAARYAPPGVDPEAMREGFQPQIPKRVAIEFAERDRVSWDHSKLGGTY